MKATLSRRSDSVPAATRSDPGSFHPEFRTAREHRRWWLKVPIVVGFGFICVSAAAQQVVPRIINGLPDQKNQFPSVGVVGSRLYGGYASGTLISSVHVLTAAHVAELMRGPSDGTFEVGGQVCRTTQIYVHPQYDRRTGANDIAVLQLERPVLDVEPSLIYRGTPQPGDELIIVGFGAGGTSETGSDGTFGTKLVGTTSIEEVGETLIIWTFDNESESNTAPGDSGGPGFLEVEGELLLAAVTSAGTQPDAGLGDIAISTRVDAFADWIDSLVQSVDVGTGQEDEAEGGGDTAGETGQNTDQEGEAVCPSRHPPVHFGRPHRGSSYGHRRRPNHRRRPSGLFAATPSRRARGSALPGTSSDHARATRAAYVTVGPRRVRH